MHKAVYLCGRFEGECHEPNFRSVVYSAIFSIESETHIPLFSFPETVRSPIVSFYSAPAAMGHGAPNFDSIPYSAIFSIESRTAFSFRHFLKTTFFSGPHPKILYIQKRRILANLTIIMRPAIISSPHYFSRT